MGFADSIRVTADKQLNQVNDKILEAASDLFKATVRGTPVFKGELINNWYTGEGTALNRSYSKTYNIAGAGSMARIQGLMKSNEFVGKDGAVSLTNITPYAYRAEYIGWPAPPKGRWTGAIGPYAMVRNAFTQVVTKLKK